MRKHSCALEAVCRRLILAPGFRFVAGRLQIVTFFEAQPLRTCLGNVSRRERDYPDEVSGAEQNERLLASFVDYLKVEKGLAKLSVEAYLRDLRQFCGVHGNGEARVVASSARRCEEVYRLVAVERSGRAFRGAQAFGNAALLPLSSVGPAHQGRSHAEYRHAQAMEGAAQGAFARGSGARCTSRAASRGEEAGAGNRRSRPRHAGDDVCRRAARV